MLAHLGSLATARTNSPTLRRLLEHDKVPKWKLKSDAALSSWRPVVSGQHLIISTRSGFWVFDDSAIVRPVGWQPVQSGNKPLGQRRSLACDASARLGTRATQSQRKRPTAAIAPRSSSVLLVKRRRKTARLTAAKKSALVSVFVSQATVNNNNLRFFFLLFFLSSDSFSTFAHLCA